MTRRDCPTSARSAFTLIEVMISIALVLVLIIGVNQVFKIAADTVGAGQVISSKVRDARAAQAVFYNELSHAVVGSDAPFLFIDSRTQPAFRNAADAQGDLDSNPLTIDIDNNNQEGQAAIPGENISAATYNHRNHRVDTLSFFARDLYRRQTGNPGVYFANVSSREAWITYSHLRIYQGGDVDVDASYLTPAYASDWVLGRMAMLLVPPVDAFPAGAPDGVPDTIFDLPVIPPPPRVRTAQFFWGLAPGAMPNELRPLGRATQATDNAAAPSPAVPIISDARYDLVGTTMSDFRSALIAYNAAVAAGTGGYIPDWWNVLPCSPTTSTVNGATHLGRFRCNPRPLKPIDSRKMAQTAPAMLSNCAQFMVEYAGDFLTQDNDPASPTFSQPMGFGSDGAVDYYYDPPLTSANPVRRIRWYGLPRDINGDGVIRGWQPSMPAATANNLLTDVVPLRDLIQIFAPGSAAAFEKLTYPDSNPSPPFPTIQAMPLRDNYANPVQDVPNGTTTTAGMTSTNHYVCAWGPTDTLRPTMLRLVITLDDPNGRISDGQTFEYVINLP